LEPAGDLATGGLRHPGIHTAGPLGLRNHTVGPFGPEETTAGTFGPEETTAGPLGLKPEGT